MLKRLLGCLHADCSSSCLQSKIWGGDGGGCEKIILRPASTAQLVSVLLTFQTATCKRGKVNSAELQSQQICIGPKTNSVRLAALLIRLALPAGVAPSKFSQ